MCVGESRGRLPSESINRGSRTANWFPRPARRGPRIRKGFRHVGEKLVRASGYKPDRTFVRLRLHFPDASRRKEVMIVYGEAWPPGASAEQARSAIIQRAPRNLKARRSTLTLHPENSRRVTKPPRAAVHLGQRCIVYCPQCLAEYRDGFTECSDCRVPLLAGIPPPEPPSGFDPALDLVVVLETNDGIQLALVKGLLEDAGIPFFLLGQITTLVTDVDGFLRKWVRVQVPRDRESEVRELLASMVQPDAATQDAGDSEAGADREDA